MKIHISKATADLLDDTLFTIEERGHVEVKVCFLGSHKLMSSLNMNYVTSQCLCSTEVQYWIF